MEILQAMGVISKVTTLVDGGVKVVVDTGEMAPQQMTHLFALKGKSGWFVFKEDQVRLEDVPEIDTDLDEVGKTPAQRLRAVLYVLWEQQADKKAYPEFEVYYRSKLERIIDGLKEKLD